ncbi:MAG: PLP-dependent transferase [Planctomycetota bacterium]
MTLDLEALRARLAGGDTSIESRLLHLPDPGGDGPVVPDIPASSMWQAPDEETLAARFQSIIDSDPPVDRVIPEGAAKIYLRLGSPLEWRLADAIALAQGGDTSILFCDGMRAIASAVAFRLHAGAEMITGVPLYGCTDNLFSNWMPKLGVKVHFVPPDDVEGIRAKINRRTRVVYVETVSNPSLKLADLPALKAMIAEVNADRAEEEKVGLVIDNTFATPYACDPFALEPALDETIVVHSTTKGINGFSAGLGGAVVIPWKYWKTLFLHKKDFGGTLAPEQAHHLFTRSLRTMALRIRTMQKNSAALAELLEAHPAVAATIYPGLESFPQHDLARQMLVDWNGDFAPGHMISFVMDGATDEERMARGKAVMDQLSANSKLYVTAVSLGYIATLIEHPAGGTHATVAPDERESRGIVPGLIRLAVGIEPADDLLRDLLAALDAV